MGFIAKLLGLTRPKKVRIDASGPCERTVYTYIPGPVSGLAVGDEAYACVEPRDYVMTSAATGYSHNTAEDGDAALSYKGEVFGAFGSGIARTLKEVAAAGYSVRVRIKRVGTYVPDLPEEMLLPNAPEIPDIVVMLEKTATINYWWSTVGRKSTPSPVTSEDLSRLEEERIRGIKSAKAGLDLREARPQACLYPNEKTFLGPSFPTETSAFTPEFEVIPTKPGSSAKPHILIKDGDMPLYELTARSVAAYKIITENIGRRCEGSMFRDYYESGDGNCVWKMLIVFDEQ